MAFLPSRAQRTRHGFRVLVAARTAMADLPDLPAESPTVSAPAYRSPVPRALAVSTSVVSSVG